MFGTEHKRRLTWAAALRERLHQPALFRATSIAVLLLAALTGPAGPGRPTLVAESAPETKRAADTRAAQELYESALRTESQSAEEALGLYTKVVQKLEQHERGHSALARYAAARATGLLVQLNRFEEARRLSERLEEYVEVFGLRDPFARVVRSNARLIKRGKPRRLRSPGRPPAEQPDTATGLAPAEVAVLKSYLAAFRLKRHTRAVRARTYPGRQQDTVLLINDLLQPGGPRETAALSELRRNLVPEPASHAHGRGMLFIDIGPAISNRWTPAVTALALCSAFPRMDVVGLDLPDEVRVFMQRVSPEVRRSVTMHRRFHVLSGDGTQSLTEQLAERERFPLRDRALPPLRPGAPVIVRTSNAIDIYFPWQVIGPTLARLGRDFTDHPLLLLFNRTILFKPRGSSQLTVIGRLSQRGFWHNSLRFDSAGEAPYLLLGRLSEAFPKTPSASATLKSPR